MRAESSPFTWAQGACQLALALALYDVEDGFGLGEVDPAVQEGPFREFPRLGEPCAAPAHEGEDRPLGRDPPWE